MADINHLIEAITNQGFKPNINLDRPTYVQPEDRILYRSSRLIVILGMLNTDYGLSKNVIACVDFLLRNEAFQTKFVLEYFAGNKNVIKKLEAVQKAKTVEIDFNIVQYKSVPWDLRFNDMLMYLFARELITYKSDINNHNIRILISQNGIEYFKTISIVFPNEINFLENFGKKMLEAKTIKIITEVIPNSYWKHNAKFDNQ